MNEEWAVDPAVACHVGELKLLLAKVGFYEGRFISRFPKSWIKSALSAISDDIARAKALALLERARTRSFISTGRQYDKSATWINNALTQHRTKPFANVVSVVRAPECTHIEDLDPLSFAGSRDARIVGSFENIISALTPILCTAGSLYLIDPYFKPWDRWSKRLFTAVLGIAHPKCLSFTAFVSEEKWNTDRQTAEGLTREHIPLALFPKTVVNIVVCRSLPTDSLHARYLFSELGGIRLDKGLQTSRSLIDLSLIDESVHNGLLHCFVERPLPYPVTDHITFA